MAGRSAHQKNMLCIKSFHFMRIGYMSQDCGSWRAEDARMKAGSRSAADRLMTYLRAKQGKCTHMRSVHVGQGSQGIEGVQAGQSMPLRPSQPSPQKKAWHSEPIVDVNTHDV